MFGSIRRFTDEIIRLPAFGGFRLFLPRYGWATLRLSDRHVRVQPRCLAHMADDVDLVGLPTLPWETTARFSNTSKPSLIST